MLILKVWYQYMNKQINGKKIKVSAELQYMIKVAFHTTEGTSEPWDI